MNAQHSQKFTYSSCQGSATCECQHFNKKILLNHNLTSMYEIFLKKNHSTANLPDPQQNACPEQQQPAPGKSHLLAGIRVVGHIRALLCQIIASAFLSRPGNTPFVSSATVGMLASSVPFIKTSDMIFTRPTSGEFGC